ncbi:MAG: hypothetical protein M3R15_12580 [Acidobacteriota bacterium]|nr:hypothetical protein [Acidobacteriota bacterium]
MFFRDQTHTRLPETKASAFGTHEWLMYRAVFVRGLPSIDHFVLISKKYLPRLCSTSAVEMSGPIYSIIRFPAVIGLIAKRPKPVAVRLTTKRRLPFVMGVIIASSFEGRVI